MKFTIYGKQDCEYCDKARRLLKSKNLAFTYLQLDRDYTIDDLWAKVKFTTYPQIFMNDYHIGGYEKLFKYIENL
jgi:glutaredoxin